MLREAVNRIIRNGICTNILVLANILVYVVLELRGSTLDSRYMLENGAMLAPLVLEYGQYYRIFTAMFLHFGIQHLFNNMLVLFFLGDNLERVVGKVRFVLIYLLSGVGAGILSCLLNYLKGEVVVSAGASGAVFGIIGALLYLVILHKGHLLDMTLPRLALLSVFSLYGGFTDTGIDNAAHVGGFAAGFVLAMILYRRKKATCRFDSDTIQ